MVSMETNIAVVAGARVEKLKNVSTANIYGQQLAAIYLDVLNTKAFYKVQLKK